MVTVIGTKYVGNGRYGDFKYMIEQDYEMGIRTNLYIYNDNIEAQKKKHVLSSGGNAVIREYNIHNVDYDYPLSAGMVTGSRQYRRGQGFKSLSEKVKRLIQESIDIIKQVMRENGTTTIYYSAEDSSGIIGTSIFQVNDLVKEYITEQIHALGDEVRIDI